MVRPDIVLRYFEGIPDNADLSLQKLTQKLAMLLALANAGRCSADVSHQYKCVVMLTSRGRVFIGRIGQSIMLY